MDEIEKIGEANRQKYGGYFEMTNWHLSQQRARESGDD
jgi:hypothetical protein